MPRVQVNKFSLLTTCVQCAPQDVPAIHDMINGSREVTFATFALHTNWVRVAQELGYTTSRERGLRLQDDYHVRFHRSAWKGQRCYYMVHSAIEFIFVEPANNDE